MKGKLIRYGLMPMLIFTASGFFASASPRYECTARVSGTDTGMIANPKPNGEPGDDHTPNNNQVRLDATYSKEGFDIIWSTQTEKGCDHFVIERSLDGVHFQRLGEVKGSVPCTRKDNFFFADHVRSRVARKNDFYYRLRQVEINGQSTNSKILIARMYDTRSVSAISITPDPALNDILVNVQLKQSSFVVMKLADKAGNEVLRKALHGDPGLNIYKLDASSHLAAGNYSLEIIVNSNERLNMKLLKS